MGMPLSATIGWGVLFKRTIKETIADNCFGLAAQLAYYCFLSVFPALLVIVACLPALLNLGGASYALTAIVAGGVFLSLALSVHRLREGRDADRAARRLFTYSIFYLFVLFAVLLLEAALGRYLNLSGVSLG